jgi:hypothetical protein
MGARHTALSIDEATRGLQSALLSTTADVRRVGSSVLEVLAPEHVDERRARPVKARAARRLPDAPVSIVGRAVVRPCAA